MEEIMKDHQQAQQAQQGQKPLPTPRKVRGTLTIKSEDDVEFRADRHTGISSQEQISKTGDSKLYRTVGEKKNKLVAHISVPSDDPDPAASMSEQLEQLTRGMQTKARPKLKGRVLLNEPNARITLSKKDSKVEMVLSIDLKTNPNYNQALMNLMYKVNQCFATNQTSLVNAR